MFPCDDIAMIFSSNRYSTARLEHNPAKMLDVACKV